MLFRKSDIYKHTGILKVPPDGTLKDTDIGYEQIHLRPSMTFCTKGKMPSTNRGKANPPTHKAASSPQQE